MQVIPFLFYKSTTKCFSLSKWNILLIFVANLSLSCRFGADVATYSFHPSHCHTLLANVSITCGEEQQHPNTSLSTRKNTFNQQH